MGKAHLREEILLSITSFLRKFEIKGKDVEELEIYLLLMYFNLDTFFCKGNYTINKVQFVGPSIAIRNFVFYCQANCWILTIFPETDRQTDKSRYRSYEPGVLNVIFGSPLLYSAGKLYFE